MIAPHTSCKYAVMYGMESGEEYWIAAVHAINGPAGNQFVLASRQMQAQDEAHVWAPPTWVLMARVVALCQTSEAASRYRRWLREQDRESEEANVR